MAAMPIKPITKTLAECEEKNSGEPNQCVGNPINPGTGFKYQQQSDYAAASQSPLSFNRYYNHTRYQGKWTTSYSQSLTIVPINPYTPSAYTQIQVKRPSGRVERFISTDGVTWNRDGDIVSRLESIVDSNNETTGWRYIDTSDKVETYNLDGQLTQITERNGFTQTLAYELTAAQGGDDDSTTLDQVTDHFGRSLTFSYDSQKRLASVTDPAGQVYSYSYDANNNIEFVTYPDDTASTTDNPKRQYHYENTSLPSALTGITDERGIRNGTWAYDTQGRAILSEHANGADRVQISYNADGTTTAVESIDTAKTNTRTYHFTNVLGAVKIDHISGDECGSCNGGQSNTYDANGFLKTKTDWNGNVTRYTYNARGLEESRTEAFNTPDARTITTTSHSNFRLPTQIDTPRKVTDFVYDNTTADLISYTETDKTGACASNPNAAGCKRTTSYIYYTTTNSSTGAYAGLLASIDGPRTDVNDITTLQYDSQGNRSKIINALGQETLITQYDAHGNPQRITDPNSIVTKLEYDARQRLQSHTKAYGTSDVSITNFDYDEVGNITKITQGDGSFLSYRYDDAKRLDRITDNLGNYIEYTLDMAGNRKAEKVYDDSDNLKHALTREFNNLNRLHKIIGADAQTTEYNYDANGNVTAITDARLNTSDQVIDALNRLIEVTDPEGSAPAPNSRATTHYEYDAQDNLTRVTDANNLATVYQYNGFGEVTQQSSPDTGITSFAYDTAGNRIQQTDARGITVTYNYDALNRITAADYPGSDEDIQYTYDQTNNNNYGVGLITQINDQSGSTHYQYDARGNVSAVTTAITFGSTSQTKTTSYQYNLADQITQISYPSGKIINSPRNSIGQVQSISLQVNSTTTKTLASNISYLPFGPLTQLTFGNGLTETRQYDQDYRISSIQTANDTQTLHNQSYDYDANSNVSQIDNLTTPADTQNFDYDPVNRLSEATGNYGSIDYSHDGVGNRLTKVEGSQTDTYSYASNSHYLLNVNATQNYTYDAVGNMISDGNYTYTYNAQNRLHQVSENATIIAEYIYNALGQRVLKTAGNTTTLFYYDTEGRLLTELWGSGHVKYEYIYLNGNLLARNLYDPFTSQAIPLYYHNDHLGTPQRLSNWNQATVWQASYNPFGAATVIINTFEQNIRFPGQYYDQETGLHYNYFRYYDPSTGRYITSDPIGLEGGLNTYAYVENDPINWTDPEGTERRKYEKPANPNKKPPPPHRVPGGDRERNVGHPDAEEHSRRPKGGTRSPRIPFIPFIVCPLCEYVFPDPIPDMPTEEDLEC